MPFTTVPVVSVFVCRVRRRRTVYSAPVKMQVPATVLLAIFSILTKMLIWPTWATLGRQIKALRHSSASFFDLSTVDLVPGLPTCSFPGHVGDSIDTTARVVASKLR